jgi:UDP-hydrolysing UDP-N-acetyl-D-glucosamine 2-epimerase
MNKIRKICVVVTARPSYSRIKTALLAIDSHPDLELQLVLAGSALLNRYGSSDKIIEKDGFKITAKVYSILEGENLAAAAKTTGIGLSELSNVFLNIRPDIVVSIADRFETISTSLAAAYMNIPLAHIQGGEVTGNIDEKVRHANTKLADYHFVSSINAYNRVIKLGENPKYVFNVGCPSIDLAKKVLNTNLDFDHLSDKYPGIGAKIDLNNPYLVVMQHPVTNEYSMSKVHVEKTLHAINELKLPTFWFWPNVDAGSDGTSKGIRSFRENNDLKFVNFIKNMEPQDILILIKNSKCLIGNSSVGIREGSFLGVPVVNIGSRQNRRDRGFNVIDVEYDKNKIKNAINKWINSPKPELSEVYGGGQAGAEIAKILSKVDLTFHKTIMY